MSIIFKRVVPCVLTMTIFGTLSAGAIEIDSRYTPAAPVLELKGNQADCSFYIADSSATKVSATLTLKQGSTVVGKWTDSGTKSANPYGTCSATKGKTYTLTATYSITKNGKTTTNSKSVTDTYN